MTDDLISRQAVIDVIDKRINHLRKDPEFRRKNADIDLYGIKPKIEVLPSAQPEGYIKIPKTGIDDLSDGFHTFRQLYYQRMMLFATIVKQNKDKAWKSLRHEDGELCFGGGWFIVGIDTPEGTYTYHYEANYYSMFDCKELERARHWDGHTEKDVTRLLSLPSAQPTYTDAEIQNMQDLEQAQIEKAYQLGREDAEPKWIPCSKKLPKRTSLYYVTIRDEKNDIEYTSCMNFYVNLALWEVDVNVIAWMPLPKPYKPQEME